MFYALPGWIPESLRWNHSPPLDIRKAAMISAISGRISIQSRDVELLEGMRE
jgi:hypothetical protein